MHLCSSERACLSDCVSSRVGARMDGFAGDCCDWSSIHRWRSPSTPEVDYDRLTPIVEAEVSRCVHLHPLLQAPDRPSAGLGPVPVGSVPQSTAEYRRVPQSTAEYPRVP